jgi:F0F1-type ATP synthase assembly protein I
MSEYTQALAELVALPPRLEERIARSQQEVAAERKRREREIEKVAGEHSAVVSRLEAVLGRARGEGVDLGEGREAGEERHGDLSADPVAYAQQLVGRLEEALSHFRYTRDALAAEEEKLSEEERKRAAEERRRREREELRRAERWEKARQGTVGLRLALAAAVLVGLAAGALGSPAVLAVPVLVALAAAGLAMGVASTLPALALSRTTGSQPASPAAPPRETRLGAAGYAAAALAGSGLGLALTALATGAAATGFGALALAAAGFAGSAAVWWALPRAK